MSYRSLAICLLGAITSFLSESFGLLNHSNRGSQYASGAYRARLAAHGLVGSMSRKSDCWDNAVVESFFATIERELVRRQRWSTPGALARLRSTIDG